MEMKKSELPHQILGKINARLERLSQEELADIHNYIFTLHPLNPMNEKNYEKEKEEFLEAKKRTNRETFRAYKRAISQFEAFFKNRTAKPWAITWENIDFFYGKCKKEQSSSNLNQQMAALSSFYRYLSGKYQLQNPFNDKEGKKWLKSSPSLRKIPQKTDIVLIYNETKNKMIKLAIILSSEYGILPRHLKGIKKCDGNFCFFDDSRRIKLSRSVLIKYGLNISGNFTSILRDLCNGHEKVVDRIRKMTKKLLNEGKLASAFTLRDIKRYYDRP